MEQIISAAIAGIIILIIYRHDIKKIEREKKKDESLDDQVFTWKD